MQLHDLFFALASQLYALDGNYTTRVYVQSAVDRAELAFADALSQLLWTEVTLRQQYSPAKRDEQIVLT